MSISDKEKKKNTMRTIHCLSSKCEETSEMREVTSESSTTPLLLTLLSLLITTQHSVTLLTV